MGAGPIRQLAVRARARRLGTALSPRQAQPYSLFQGNKANRNWNVTIMTRSDEETQHGFGHRSEVLSFDNGNRLLPSWLEVMPSLAFKYDFWGRHLRSLGSQRGDRYFSALWWEKFALFDNRDHCRLNKFQMNKVLRHGAPIILFGTRRIPSSQVVNLSRIPLKNKILWHSQDGVVNASNPNKLT